MKRTYKPGETFQNSGQGKVVDKNGKSMGFEVTGVKGKTVPPTPKPGGRIVMSDLTKHKGR